MTSNNSINPPGGPAKSPEELSGLVFDVPCMKCGKNVFTVPYVANVHHLLTCQACKGETWVLIDELGGIKYFEREVALKKIEAAKRAAKQTKENSETDNKYYFYLSKFEIRISWLYIEWGIKLKETDVVYNKCYEITNVNWTI